MNNLNRIQALIELKEKGAISDAEFKQMIELIEAEADNTTLKKTSQSQEQKEVNKTPSRVREDISALREKEILAQIINAYEKKDWKMLRAKYELLKDKAAVSLEITTALFAFERRQIWLEKEEKTKRLEAQKVKDAKKKKTLLVAGSVAVIVIFGMGLYFFKSTNTETSVEQSEVIYNKKHQQSNGNQIEKKPALQLEAPKLDEKKNIGITKVNQPDFNKNTNQTTVEQEKIKQPEMKDEFKTQTQNGNQNKELLKEFPEILLEEAESLKNKILDPNITKYDKILASSRVKTICRDYNAGLNNKWKSNVQTSIRLNRCYVIAEDYF
jgi:hypothetical protein